MALNHDPEVIEFVERTTREQGLSVKVTDPAVIEVVVTLLGEGRRPVRASRSDRDDPDRSGSSPGSPG
jgi:hypothetical protein